MRLVLLLVGLLASGPAWTSGPASANDLPWPPSPSLGPPADPDPDLPPALQGIPRFNMPRAPGITAPLVPPAAKAEPAPVRSRAEMIDELFKRLAASADGDEASGVAARIQRLWLDSGSDTVDLLMSRASTAVEKGDTDLALQLLDKIVALEPDWAEGWHRRAKLRFQKDDDDAAMSDIGHVLALEPRHFGAMTGMAVILQRHGFGKNALMLMRRAADIYPHNGDLAKMIDALTPEVEGRNL